MLGRSQLMDACRLLLTIFVMASPSESMEIQDWVQDQPLCEDCDMESFLLLEGEAFYSVPYIVKYLKQPLNVTWYKNAPKVEFISADVKDRVHYQDSALFLLDLVPEDSGVYVGRLVEPSGQCSNAFLNVTVFKTSYKNNSDVFYGKIQTSDMNQKVSCPQGVEKTCDDLKGNFTWYKNFTLIQGEHNPNLWIMKATRRDQGIYTCVCNFTYNNRTHISSGCRLLSVKESGGGASYNIMILSPTSEKQICDEGAKLKLSCSVFCGNNVDICEARWYINGKRIDHMDGYNQSTVMLVEPSGQCSNAFLNVKMSYKNNSNVFYGKIQTSDTNQKVSCPQIVKKTCDDLKGNFTWYKNFTLIQGEHNPNLWIMKATRRDQGIYTCVCSFTYNNRTHISSGSRLLSVKESGGGASYNIMILSPTSEKQICDEGAKLKLSCSVFCA
ncbi:interleukin-1 receptor type 2-like isoform X2 [Betta splendens]|uniref:Interleukin-1 receptor type 2-like isoform X2 n=1 Tax=Betta splendens TaxID=158456 RepID=A0A6P7LHL8_BETSP|nr:interleukin-1 receptor type 2-like isoform X2 [Betta splendens]